MRRCFVNMRGGLGVVCRFVPEVVSCADVGDDDAGRDGGRVAMVKWMFRARNASMLLVWGPLAVVSLCMAVVSL